jgi:hypothetical protein
MLRTRLLSMSVAAFCLVAGVAHADAITDANANANAVAVAGCIVPGENPLHESRLYAMVHLATPTPSARRSSRAPRRKRRWLPPRATCW